MFLSYEECMVVMKKNIDQAREEFIEKGSEAVEARTSAKWTTICLRIPKDMVRSIDSLVEEKPGFSRTTWILQTLHKKLEKK